MNGEVTLEKKMKHIKCKIKINIYIMFVSFQVMELNPNGIMAASLPTAYKVSAFNSFIMWTITVHW